LSLEKFWGRLFFGRLGAPQGCVGVFTTIRLEGVWLDIRYMRYEVCFSVCFIDGDGDRRTGSFSI